MKKIMFTLITMLAIATSAKAMSYEQARQEALFLTDKMAYELNLTDEQYEAAYEINLDYLMCVTSRDNVYGTYWERRNSDLYFVLHAWQWELFRAATYFYRPLRWYGGYWHFSIYTRYPHRDYFYFGRPHFYVTYHGGHSWHRNGGHSYYEHHTHHYRPNIAQHQHSGMRDGWNRGNYRSNNDHHGSVSHNGGSRRHDDRSASHNGGSRHHNDGSTSNNGGSHHHNDGSTSNNGGSHHHNDGSASQNGGSRHHNDGSASHYGGSRSSNFGGSRGSSSSSSSRAMAHNSGSHHASSMSGPSRSNAGGSSRGNVGGSSRGGGRR